MCATPLLYLRVVRYDVATTLHVAEHKVAEALQQYTGGHLVCHLLAQAMLSLADAHMGW